MRPYHKVAIIECGEPMVSIPLEMFAVESPHAYEKLGAPYGDRSPYFLRQNAIECLIRAQNYLQVFFREWRIQVFDAYRPVEVQKFMVEYTFAQVLQKRRLSTTELSPAQCQEIWQEVYQIWAEPSLDAKTPPPHSTGGAVDVTLVDETGKIVDMGSPIDELSARSLPDYYIGSQHPQAQQYHANRLLLLDVMKKAGFERNPKEWWHFSFGDQMWAWLNNQAGHKELTARYGRLVN